MEWNEINTIKKKRNTFMNNWSTRRSIIARKTRKKRTAIANANAAITANVMPTILRAAAT